MKMWIIKILPLIMLFAYLHAEKSIWEIIAESNQKFLDDKKKQADDNGDRLVDGDILKNRKDYIENKNLFKKELRIQNSPKFQLLQPVFDHHRRLWKRRIPYYIKSELRKDAAKIKASLKKIEKASCLTFFEVGYGGGGHKNWIEFFSGDGCFAGARKYWKKAATLVSLGPLCRVEAIIIHEVLHVLGFEHEQTRPDRDSYVNVYLNKVTKSMRSNFNKHMPGDSIYHGTPYDIKSIMQYSQFAFRKSGYTGNTIEYKFDPNQRLGGNVLTVYDKLELNRKYQCAHVDLEGKKVSGVMRGWSKWSPMSECMVSWKKDCTKARYRFCVDSDKCAGANEYGVMEDVRECSKAECEADANKVDGMWGPWSEYGPCDSKCGYGIHKRTRQCNNPSPKGKGKKCEGFGIERKLCRKQRCGGPGGWDTNFEKGYGSWERGRFFRQKGRFPGATDGPSNDYTGLLTETRGYYLMATQPKLVRDMKTSRFFTSKPLAASKSGCLSFQYMLNGNGLHKTLALSIFLKTPDGNYLNTAFTKGGHHGKFWKQGMVNLNNIVAGTKIVFEARLLYRAGSIVAIDDIFYDKFPCLEDLDREECKDTSPKCTEYAEKNYCSTNWKYMLRKCCRTCQGHEIKPNTKDKSATKSETCKDAKEWSSKCPGWAKKGECKKNSKWMNQNCCSSCKNIKPGKCEDVEKWAKDCPGWAKEGECKKNEKWMSTNCCSSCKNIKPVKGTISCKDNKIFLKKCEKWGKEGHCAKNTWMKRNCCASCNKFCVNKHGNEAECEKWAADKKNDYCKKRNFMAEKCCSSCYKRISKN